MTNFLRGAVLSCALWSGMLLAQPTSLNARTSLTQIPVEGMTLSLPAGWTKSQEALNAGTIIFGFAKSGDYVNFFVKNETGLNFHDIFENGSDTLSAESIEKHGQFQWTTVVTSKKNPSDDGKTNFIKGFLTELNGKTYFGYSRAESVDTAKANANAFLDAFVPTRAHTYGSYSLTGQGFKGHKYYFGWGAVMDGDPEVMQNEVLYDVNHTHDIFTKEVGGDYIGFKLFEHDANWDTITSEWNKLKNQITGDDMYVQYSSGHGSDTELAVGVTYAEIRDAVLSMKAKEKIVFLMACESGGLVDSFNRKKSEWQDYQKDGRTLFVMSSSKTEELSQGGPDTDDEEPGAPIGAPGSSFGFALWKALIGHADGFSDGVKDGFISIGEIQDFVRWQTLQVTYQEQTPQWTGSYNPGMIMNRVPSKTFLESLGVKTESMSNEQIVKLIQQLDHSLRVH